MKQKGPRFQAFDRKGHPEAVVGLLHDLSGEAVESSRNPRSRVLRHTGLVRPAHGGESRSASRDSSILMISPPTLQMLSTHWQECTSQNRKRQRKSKAVPGFLLGRGDSGVHLITKARVAKLEFYLL